MRSNKRLIARLDVKGPNLIKGIHLEGLRVMGDPQEFATRYYDQGIDELIYMDIVASLYGRNHLAEIIEHTAQNVFIPLTVGGGVRSIEDVQSLLSAGADKVALNTQATRTPELITQIAHRFGSQCTVVSVEAKQVADNYWEAYTDNGREHTHRDAVEWAIEAESRGAGEILLTSIDKEGTAEGFDTELVERVSSSVSIPVIASGGMGSLDHMVDVLHKGADAVAMAHVLHYDLLRLDDIRESAVNQGFEIRTV